jgi:16S rRNA (cytosine1402-N4)-methyltransferase
MSFEHTPVLYRDILSNMRIHDDKKNIIIDMTLGLGGHATGVIQMLHPGDVFVGFDADNENLIQAAENIRKNLGNIPDITLHFVHSNFQFARQELEKLGIHSVTGVYADL